MKKLLYSLTMILVFGFANAQTDQGTVLLGASSNLGFTSTSIDGSDDNQNNFNFDLGVAPFVGDHFAFGLNLLVSSSSIGDSKTSSTAVGPFTRLYPGVNNSFFVGVGYAALSTKFESSSSFIRDSTDKGGLLSFEAGVPIWIGDSLALELSMGYSIGSGDLKNTKIFGMAFGFNFFFQKKEG